MRKEKEEKVPAPCKPVAGNVHTTNALQTQINGPTKAAAIGI